MKVAGNKALIVISIITVLTIFAAPASAAWPLQTEWIPALGPNWSNISDPIDQQSDYLDCVVDTTQPLSRQAASYWYFDGTHMYFRMILDGDPLSYQGGAAIGLRPFGWAVLIESTGDMYPDYDIGINGTGSADTLSSMYNITQDFTMDGVTGWTQSATTPTLSGGFWYLMNGMVRSGVSGGNTSGNPDYYLDFMIPITWLSRTSNVTPPAAVTSTTPIKIAFGTDASGQNINKDLVGQSDTIDLGSYFLSVPPVTPSGGYGLLNDGRHTSAANYGIWTRGETLSVYGSGWPTSASTAYNNGYIQVRVVGPTGTQYDIELPGVLTTNVGVVNLQGIWTIPSAAAAGVYSIYVMQPASTVYILKDTFTVEVANIDLSSSIKSVSPASGVATDQLTYTIVITNTGSSTATGVVLTDAIPSSTSYVANSSTMNGSPLADVVGICPFVGGYTVSTLAPNASATFTFRAIISQSAPDQTVITNTAIIRWNSITITKTATALVNAPLMTITKSVNPTTGVLPGAVLTYSVTFTNVGHSNATAIEVVDSIPSDTTYVPGSRTSSAGGTFTFQHAQAGIFDVSDALPVTAIKYSITPLVPGASVTLTFQVTVK